MATTAPVKRIKRRPAQVSGERAPIAPVRISSVQDMSVYDAYIGRTIDGLAEFQIFDYARKNGINVLIEGPTGPGKTMASRAYSAREGLHFYAVPSNVGVDPRQLFGGYIPNEEKLTEDDPAFVWVDGPVTDLVRYGGVLLINEVNFLPPRIATVIYGLLDGRREITLLDHKGEVVRGHWHKDCWCGDDECDKALLIVADMNPDYEGTIGLNKAFRNRFGIQLVWDYDPHVEIKLVAGQTLRNLAANIRKEHRDGNIETPVSTNMLMEFETLAGELGVTFAITNFINHFGSEERPAIRQVFDAAADNLTAEYKPAKKSVKGDEPPVDAQFDWGDVVKPEDYEWLGTEGK
jgi:MoxR-like ATPase